MPLLNNYVKLSIIHCGWINSSQIAVLNIAVINIRLNNKGYTEIEDSCLLVNYSPKLLTQTPVAIDKRLQVLLVTAGSIKINHEE